MGAPHWWVSSVRTFWGLTQAAASVSGEAAQEHGEGCRSRPAAVVRSATAVLAGQRTCRVNPPQLDLERPAIDVTGGVDVAGVSLRVGARTPA